ncbi:hypothetical protein QTJ16_004446 [Diplocarpon rosae]|uniref:RING-type domain-containing protein n=1 Tax=Diplocarpon rosae TaxID=946125 RepID=A0AAD9T082_9HELO|nr:hypothetical protein QTJ16_004446 [Diplocarpon rosae]
MCHTNISLMIACGHVVFEDLHCQEGNCIPTRSRLEALGLCEPCALSRQLIPSAEEVHESRERFREESMIQTSESYRREFADQLLAEHLLASHRDADLHDARQIRHTFRGLRESIHERHEDEGEDEEWTIEGRDPEMSDLNRASLMGRALFAVRAPVIAQLRHEELGAQLEAMLDDLVTRRAELELDEERVELVRQMHTAMPPPDPTGGTAVERERARAEAVQAILTHVDISTVPGEDRECLICTNPMAIAQEDGSVEEACSLPRCEHRMGRDCATRWLSLNGTCPVCRHDVSGALARAQGQNITDQEMEARHVQMAAEEEALWERISHADRENDMDTDHDDVTNENDDMVIDHDDLARRAQEALHVRDQSRSQHHAERDREAEHSDPRLQQALEARVRQHEREQAEEDPALEDELARWQELRRERHDQRAAARGATRAIIEGHLRDNRSARESVRSLSQMPIELMNRTQQRLDRLNAEWRELLVFRAQNGGDAAEELLRAHDRVFRRASEVRDRLHQVVAAGFRDAEALMQDVDDELDVLELLALLH